MLIGNWKLITTPDEGDSVAWVNEKSGDKLLISEETPRKLVNIALNGKVTPLGYFGYGIEEPQAEATKLMRQNPEGF